jgi:hypothetical protein
VCHAGAAEVFDERQRTGSQNFERRGHDDTSRN